MKGKGKMDKKRVLVLFGGNSTEYEISLLSAASVLRNIPKDKYEVTMLGITRDGKWYLYEGDIDAIEKNTWQNSKLKKAVISPDSADRGILIETETGVELRPVDIVFPVLHGKNGEDGTMQGLLELSGIPFVGCGHLSSAVTMDKAFTNLIADFYGIQQARWRSIKLSDYRKSGDAFLKEAVEALHLPIFVKPACAGSSVGISKAKTEEELKKAMEKAFAVDKKVVLEETILGHEIEAAVIGNDEPLVSVLGEIVPCAEFYDYDAKYVEESKLYIPARLSETISERVRQLAAQIYRAADCRGISRVDFFVSDAGEIYFNEINTIPGFTSISMHAKLFAACGISYPELVDKILTYALEE